MNEDNFAPYEFEMLDLVIWAIIIVILGTMMSCGSKAIKAKATPVAPRIEVVGSDTNGAWTVYRDNRTGTEYLKVVGGGLIELTTNSQRTLSEHMRAQE